MRRGVEPEAPTMARLFLFSTAVFALALIRAAHADTAIPLPVHNDEVDLPDIAFVDDEGQPAKLSDLRGTSVLLNVWADWCVPCRKELPALDRLAGQLSGSSFQVVSIVVGRDGADAAQQFYAENNISNLRVFADPTGEVVQRLAISVLPVTILVSPQGLELAHAIGPVEWDKSSVVDFVRWNLGQRSASVAPQ